MDDYTASMAVFHVSILFQDRVPACICGFCRRGRRRAVEDCISTLSQVWFGGGWAEGLLVDSHFARLLAQAAWPERSSILLTGGCIRYPTPDSPCGGILGDLFRPPESAPEDRSRLLLPNGLPVRLILRPGAGAAAFFCSDAQQEEELYRALSARFPAPDLPARLKRAGAGYLQVLDYAPGDPVCTGCCQAWLSREGD